MARIKLRLGENEIEVDSRDFYVDNQTLGELIENISRHLNKNQAKIIYENNNEEIKKPQELTQLDQYGLEYLDDAEVYEPEFNEPKPIESHEIKAKLRILETSGFFNSPRTVTETVQQLIEYGWSASPLEVSKALAKMASNREIFKNSKESRLHYFIQNTLPAN
jgi:beta-glucosidase/6-phospho-beta-glucosidase/beta-galactosidase